MSAQTRIGIAGAAVFAFFLLPPAYPQSKGSGTPTTGTGSGSAGTTTGAGSTTGRTGTGNTNTNSNSNTNMPSGLPRQIMISGQVVQEDGTPPPESAAIERVCNGAAHTEGHTDTKGRFLIVLGQNNVPEDASEADSSFSPNLPAAAGMGGPGLVGSMPLANCELRARLSGFRSQSADLFDRGSLGTIDVGTILVHRIQAAEGNTVSVSTLSAPKPASKAYTKGLQLAKKQNRDGALKSFQEAVQLYSGFAAAWFEMGKLQAAGGQAGDARQSFEAAVAAEPRFTEPYVGLAQLALEQKNWRDVADVTDRVLKLNSFDYPQAFFLNAVANYNLHNVEAAEKSARSAEKLDTRHQYPQSWHLLGVILAERRDYAEAGDQLRTYLAMAPNASNAADVRRELDTVDKAAADTPQAARPER